MTGKPRRMIYLRSDPVIVVSNFDPANDIRPYERDGIVLTWHYDGDMEYAGSPLCDNALYLSEEEIPALIEALKEFTE